MKFSFIIFLLTGTIIFSQEINFRRFTPEDGLSLSQISSVTQTKNGFLFVGTYGGGFSIFDGNTFSNYSSVNGLCDNEINVFAVDDSDNVWIGTDKGLSKYDGVSFTNFSTENEISNNVIWSLAATHEGGLWIGTDSGLDYYDGNSFSNFSDSLSLTGKHVWAVYVDSKGILWIGLDDKLLTYD